jgi:asparagine synthase (glutamine-hydrolysing)
MTDRLAHRGPDYKATWTDNRGIYLGHTRLSIIDLSEKGNQPMHGPSEETTIVFNGEIYNYIELRRQLRSEGVHFRSESDTEVILALYEKYGSDCVTRLRGMFAFGLWDNTRKRLLLARDRVGKKPLYYASEGGNFYFASEIKAIQSVIPRSSLKLDEAALDEYLSFGFISGGKTIYSNILELPPGSLLTIDIDGNPDIKAYWGPQWLQDKKLDFNEAIEKLKILLSDSVVARLRSDVPVGIFLSGGMDSGLLTALASANRKENVMTFSVGFEDMHYDERPMANVIAQRYGTDHHEIVIRPDVVSVLPRIVQAYDEPFADPSTIPSFYISEYASKFVKVILTGDGGDELFGGYRRHRAAALYEKIAGIHLDSVIQSVARNIYRTLPTPQTHRTKYAFLYRFLHGVACDQIDRVFTWFSGGFDTNEKKGLYKDPPACDYGMNLLKERLTLLGNLNMADQMMALDFEWMLPNDLLVKMDIASMAHGLEARSPFLDQHLVQWAHSLPETVKLSGVSTKPLLRAIAKHYLPERIANGPKRGFEIPLRRWLTHNLRDLCEDSILTSNGIVSDLFNKTYLEKLLYRKIPVEPRRWAVQIWTLLMLSLWDRFCYRPDA